MNSARLILTLFCLITYFAGTVIASADAERVPRAKQSPCDRRSRAMEYLVAINRL